MTSMSQVQRFEIFGGVGLNSIFMLLLKYFEGGLVDISTQYKFSNVWRGGVETHTGMILHCVHGGFIGSIRGEKHTGRDS